MTQPKSIYDEKSTLEDERVVEDREEESDGKKPRTLDEKSEEPSDLTDMQTAIKQLFPSDLGDEIVNKVMVARIAPDVFIPLLKMLVNEEIAKTDPSKKISVASTVAKIYTLLSIGLDGKGRIDHIELTGASKEVEDLEKLSKGLFG